MNKATLSPDDAAAHMYPSDLNKFEFGEHVAEAFSIPVGCPRENSAPLFTTGQAEAYAAAKVREALEEAAEVTMNAPITANMLDSDSAKAVCFHASSRIRALIPAP